MKQTFNLLCCLVGVALVNGCGGGGGGGTGSGDTIRMSYSPSPLTRTIYQHNPGTTVTLYTTMSPVPTSNVYVLLEDPQQVLIPGPLAVTNQGGGSFSADLPINGSLSVGQHDGHFNLHLCKDVNCASEYTLDNPTIPYEFTVESLIAAEIKIAGVSQSSVQPGIDQYGARTYRVTVHSGQDVEVIPDKSALTWTTSGPQVTFIPMAGSTPSTWKAGVAFSTPGDDYAFAEIQGQKASNGETVKVVLDVVP